VHGEGEESSTIIPFLILILINYVFKRKYISARWRGMYYYHSLLGRWQQETKHRTPCSFFVYL